LRRSPALAERHLSHAARLDGSGAHPNGGAAHKDVNIVDGDITEAGWGRLPCWGFGEVIETRHAELTPGARVLGCFPMSSHLVVSPTRIGGAGFVDDAIHRRELPGAHSNYTHLPVTDETDEDLHLLLRPLYLTSFLLVDWLASEGYFGARAVVVSSASSKTASAAARLLRPAKIRTLGLTSAAHVDFVRGLDVYDDVVTYDAITELPVERAIYVDFTGSAAIRRTVHTHYQENLVHSASVGLTQSHSMDLGVDDLPGPKPALFFAPERIAVRNNEWGQGGVNQRFDEVWHELAHWASTWLRIKHCHGIDAARSTYLDVLNGRVDPDSAHVLRI
jgi:hypothetical protein